MRTISKSFLRTIPVVGLLVGLSMQGSCSNESKGKLATVEQVDLHRYTGTWYEISRYPNRFEKSCASNVTANYTLRRDGKIEVVNSCQENGGKVKASRGTAKVKDPHTNARLAVTFFWPFYGDYWIIDLDKDYRYAVVGEPSRKYLWILSRTPALDDETYARIIQKIESLGYDTAKLIKTPQSTIEK